MASRLAVACQKGADRSYDLDALAGSGSHTPDRAGADIAEGEDVPAAALRTGTIHH